MEAGFGSSLRLQLLLPLLLVPVLTWLGFDYLQRVEDRLLQAQTTALESTANTLAVHLQSNADLLAHATIDKTPVAGRELYGYKLHRRPLLDGKDDDWTRHRPHAIGYGRGDIIEIHQAWSRASLHFDLMTGIHEDALYAFLHVTDDRVVYREPNSISVHRNDNLQIVLDAGARLRRYTLATIQPGELEAFVVAPREAGGRALGVENRLEGYWLGTEAGYNLEIRIPLDMIDKRLGFAVADVDDPAGRQLAAVIGTSNIYDATEIGTIVLPLPAIERQLQKFVGLHSRIYVVDAHRRVIAEAGDIRHAAGIWANSGSTWRDDWVGRLEQAFLAPLYAVLIADPAATFDDERTDAARVEGHHINRSFAGTAAVAQRRTAGGELAILSAAYPIYADEQTVGAVLVEQTTAGISSLVNRAAARILTISLLTILAGGAVLTLVGTLIGRRLRRLQHQVEASTDTQGRVKHSLAGSAAGDEIGDLTRSFADTVERLRQYNTWLEDMSRRLAHELRTPVTVVRSSLDNLSLQVIDDETRVYLDRANEGVHRLASILNSMTEATRLEQALDASEQEIFELTEVVSGCVAGYRLAWPGQAFELSVEAEDVKIDGIPDLIAQMLDKLVANAVDFAVADTAVKVRLTVEDDQAVIRVINDGPTLPDDLRDRLFDAMVSARETPSTDVSHLGLGLYIARTIAEFHGGGIRANNRDDARGVIVTVQLPIMRLTGRRP